MPDLITLDDPTIDAQLTAYYDNIDDLTAQALAGLLREDVFRSEMRRITEAALVLVFLLAGGDRATTGAEQAIAKRIRATRNSVEQLASDIYDGRYSVRGKKQVAAGRPEQTAGEGRDKLRNRLALWVFTLAGMDAVGKVHSPPAVMRGELTEQEFQWLLGLTEKHCSTCLEMDGQTKQTSAWRALAAIGVEPQGAGLECGGWKCDCKLR